MEMLPRPAAERHAEHREDIRRPRVLRPADDGFDIFPRVVDLRQQRHHRDTRINALGSQCRHCAEPLRRGRGAGFRADAERVVGTGHGETHRRVGGGNFLQDVGVALRQGALGDDMHRETLVGDHAQCPAGQPQLALDGHVGGVHRSRADRGAFFPPGTQLGWQQFQCVALHGYLGDVPDPVAVAARVAVDAPVLASPVEVHVVGDAEPPIGRPQLREDRFGFDIPHGRGQ